MEMSEILGNGFEDLLPEETEETPVEIETPPEEVTEDPSQEGEGAATPEEPALENIPFHKHPAWKRKQKEIEEMRQKYSELEEQLKNMAQKPENSTERTVPLHMQPLFGENYEAYEAFVTEARQTARAELLESTKKSEEARLQEERRNEEFKSWAESEFERLSDVAGEDLTSTDSNIRNQILNVCETYGVVDSRGYPDFAKALELYNKIQPKTDKTEIRKIAAKTNGKTAASTEENPVLTASLLKKKQFEDFFN